MTRPTDLHWEPINNYPGDQMFDAIPGTESTSYWGEIGRADGDSWSWTIVATDDFGDQREVDGGRTATETEAKAAVENWRPTQ